MNLINQNRFGLKSNPLTGNLLCEEEDREIEFIKKVSPRQARYAAKKGDPHIYRAPSE